MHVVIPTNCAAAWFSACQSCMQIQFPGVVLMTISSYYICFVTLSIKKLNYLASKKMNNVLYLPITNVCYWKPSCWWYKKLVCLTWNTRKGVWKVNDLNSHESLNSKLTTIKQTDQRFPDHISRVFFFIFYKVYLWDVL